MKLKKIMSLMCGAFVLSPFILPMNTDAARVVGYYENWSIYTSNAPYGSGYSTFPSTWNAFAPHIDVFNYAFATFNVNISNGPTNSGYYPTGDWSIHLSDANDIPVLLPKAYNLRTINPALKVILSVGGWGFTSPQASPPSGYGQYGYYTNQFFSLMANDQSVVDYSIVPYTGGNVISAAGTRDAFAESCFLYTSGSAATGQAFDGIDIDWEYPGRTDRGGAATDYNGLLKTLTAIRTKLPSGEKIISMATASGADTTAPGAAYAAISWPAGTFADGTVYPSSASLPVFSASVPTAPFASVFEQQYFTWLVLVAHELDWMNVMTYDYYGPSFAAEVSGQPVNSELAPLYATNGAAYNPGGLCVDRTMTMYTSITVPATTTGGPAGVATNAFTIAPSKLNMGIPAYGRGFANSTGVTAVPGTPFTTNQGTPPQPYSKQDGYYNYYEIVDAAGGTGATYQNVVQNTDSQTTYANSPPYGDFVSFDAAGDIPAPNNNVANSVANKCQYILNNNLGGAMIWALDCDDVVNGFPVLNSVIGVIKKSAAQQGVPANPYGPTTGGTN